MDDPLSSKKRLCPVCGKTAEPYCDLPECGLAGDVFERIAQRNRDLWDGLRGDDAALLRALDHE